MILSDDDLKSWWLWLELSKLAALLGGGIYALWQYRRTAKSQFEAPIWNQQIQWYSAASDSAAQLAWCSPSSDRWEEARDRFWTLYNGSLCIVENAGVEKAMVIFGKLLVEFERELKKRNQVSETPAEGITLEASISAKQEELKKHSLEISYACRNSLGEHLSKPLPHLNNLKRTASTAISA